MALVSAVEERKAATAALPEDAVAGAAGVRKVSKVAAAPKAAMPRSKYSHAPGKVGIPGQGLQKPGFFVKKTDPLGFFF